MFMKTARRGALALGFLAMLMAPAAFASGVADSDIQLIGPGIYEVNVRCTDGLTGSGTIVGSHADAANAAASYCNQFGG